MHNRTQEDTKRLIKLALNRWIEYVDMLGIDRNEVHLTEKTEPRIKEIESIGIEHIRYSITMNMDFTVTSQKDMDVVNKILKS